MSLCAVTSLPASCSGAMYAGVPARTVSPVAPASPKSVIRTLPAPSSITLAGLRSRWMTPRSWAGARPARSAAPSRARAPPGTGRCGRSSEPSSSPSTYSIERKCGRPLRRCRKRRQTLGSRDHLAGHPHFAVQLHQPRGVVVYFGGQNLSATGCASVMNRRRDRPRPCRRGRDGRRFGNGRRAGSRRGNRPWSMASEVLKASRSTRTRVPVPRRGRCDRSPGASRHRLRAKTVACVRRLWAR